MEAVLLQSLNAACFAPSASEQEAAMRLLRDLEEAQSQNSLQLISALAVLIADRSGGVRAEARLLATICLKNLAAQSWARLDESCRAALWQFVHQAMDQPEPSSRVAAQTAVLIARMCRREWPGELVTQRLFPYLFSLLRRDWRLQTQAARVISEVLGEISSMRLPSSRAALVSLAAESFPEAQALWMDLSRQLCEALPGMSGGDPGALHENRWHALIDHLRVLVGVLKQLLLAGYSALGTRVDLSAFLSVFLSHLGVCSHFCSVVFTRAAAEDCDVDDEPPESAGLDLEACGSSLLSIAAAVRSLAEAMAGTFPAVQSEHPLPTVSVLVPFLAFSHGQLVNTFSGTLVFSEPLVLAHVTTLSQILSCGAYTLEDNSNRPKAIARRLNAGSHSSPEEDAEAAKRGHAARASFFDTSVVNSLMGLLLHHLLYPGRRELEAWVDNPEEFFETQQTLTSTDSVRTAAEGLFLAVLDYSPDAVVDRLLSALLDFDAQLQLCGQPSDPMVIFWSSAYLCCGLGVYKLNSRVDASEWFSRVIGPLITSQVAVVSREQPQILLLRCIWLVSCWAHALSPSLMPPLLDLFVTIIGEESCCDAAVKLQTVETLTNMVSNDCLSSEGFADRYMRLIEVLCPLTARLTESESRSRTIELVSSLMSSLGSSLRPMLAPLANQLQALWFGSESSSPLKLALLQALTSVVRVAREASIELHQLLVPVLRFATSGSEESNFLAEEGVSLWLAVVRNAGSYTGPLDELFRLSIPALFAAELVPLTEPEKAKTFMLLVEAYIILGRQSFLSSNAAALKLVFDHTLCRVLPRVVSHVVRPIESMLIVCPSDAALFLLQSGALITLLRPCAAAVVSISKNFEDFAEIDLALLSYLSVCARLIVVAPSIIQQAASTVIEDGDVLLRGIARLLIDKFDAVGFSSSGLWRRKLWCLAILSMYYSPVQELLDWLPEALAICDEVSAEQIKDREEHSGYEQDEENVSADPLAITFNSMVASDGVTTVSVRRVTHERMEGLRIMLGDAVFEAIMRRVAPAAISRLVERTSGELSDGRDSPIPAGNRAP